MEAEPARAVFAGSYDEGTWSSSGGAKRPATVADSIAMTRVAGSPNLAGTTQEPPHPTSPGSLLMRSGSSLLRNEGTCGRTPMNTRCCYFKPKRPLALLPRRSWFPLHPPRSAKPSRTSPGSMTTTQFFSRRAHGRHNSGVLGALQFREVLELTHETANVIAYSASAKGKRLAFVTEPPEKNLISTKALQGGIVVSDEAAVSLIVGRQQVVRTALPDRHREFPAKSFARSRQTSEGPARPLPLARWQICGSQNLRSEGHRSSQRVEHIYRSVFA